MLPTTTMSTAATLMAVMTSMIVNPRFRLRTGSSGSCFLFGSVHVGDHGHGAGRVLRMVERGGVHLDPHQVRSLKAGRDACAMFPAGVIQEGPVEAEEIGVG